MANGESSGVAAAYYVLLSAQGEAQAWGELRARRPLDEDSSSEILLAGALERLVQAVDQFEHELIKAGVKLRVPGVVDHAD